MDLSGRGSMDLTEAARLLKQSSNASAVANPVQIPTPPLMMMQQAVAMQQFQFQQALLMQQVIATQQAAARAATVKSAAEMAAARAAEISKQLKGSDEEEEEKKSAAASPNRSKSVSRSRSVSRSPIRYRRDRSHSRSPIRYRRDRQYSPSRSRDYYSYRSRSRRGYYRGRGGDYSWNPFRRDWDRDRDRDYHSRRRSRSRSRIRRRSRTRSRSPRFRRERSGSPRHRREERKKPAQSSRHSLSRSREPKRTPSPTSQSPSATLGRKEPSRSPKKGRESGSGANHRRSPVTRSGKRVSKQPLPISQRDKHNGTSDTKEKNGSSRVVHKVDQSVFREVELQAKKEALLCPPASPAVSLNNKPPKKDLLSDDENDINSIPKKTLQPSSVHISDGDNDVHRGNISSMPQPEHMTAKFSSPDSSSVEEKCSKPKVPHTAKAGGHGRMGEYIRKDHDVIPDDGSDDDNKELDDWRDDMKVNSRERERLKNAKRDCERKVEEEKFVKDESPIFQDSKKVKGILTGQNVQNAKKHFVEDSGMETDLPEETAQGSKAGHDTRSDPRRQEFLRDLKEQSRSPVHEHNDVGKVTLEGEREMKERDTESGHFSHRVLASVKVDRTYDEGYVNSSRKHLQAHVHNKLLDKKVGKYVFEGPKLAEDVDGLTKGRVSEKEQHRKATGSREIVVSEPVVKGDSDQDCEGDIGAVLVGQFFEENDMIVSRKGKDKQRPKDVGRRYEEDEEREKRKDRHRKHRKKHKRKGDDEKEDEDKDDSEGHRDKRHHRKRHRRNEDDDEEKKDRRKKKHRSQGKSASGSAAESPRVDVEAVKNEPDRSPIQRRSSSRHKKKRRGCSKSPANSATSSE